MGHLQLTSAESISPVGSQGPVPSFPVSVSRDSPPLARLNKHYNSLLCRQTWS